MTPTPRTDALVEQWDFSPLPKVMEAHARQLERELEEVRASLKSVRQSANDSACNFRKADVKRIEAERQLTAHKAVLDKARVALERAYQVAELPSDQIAFSAALTAINSLQQCPTTPTPNG